MIQTKRFLIADVQKRERVFFFYQNSLSTFRRVKPQKLALFRALRSFHPNRTCTQILVKVCTLVIQYMQTQEMKQKRGVPTLLLEIGGQKSTPLGLYILLKKAMRRNCTTILRNTKSDVQKSGNIRKGEVINTPGY